MKYNHKEVCAIYKHFGKDASKDISISRHEAMMKSRIAPFIVLAVRIKKVWHCFLYVVAGLLMGDCCEFKDGE